MSVELLFILGKEGGERGMSVQSAPRRQRAAYSFLFSSSLRSSSSSCEKAERERSESDFVDYSRLTVSCRRCCQELSQKQHPHSLTMPWALTDGMSVELLFILGNEGEKRERHGGCRQACNQQACNQQASSKESSSENVRSSSDSSVCFLCFAESL